LRTCRGYWGLTSFVCDRRGGRDRSRNAPPMYGRNDITGRQAGRNVNGAMKEGSQGGIAHLVGLTRPDGRAAAASEDGGRGRRPDRLSRLAGRGPSSIAAASFADRVGADERADVVHVSHKPHISRRGAGEEPPPFTSFTPKMEPHIRRQCARHAHPPARRLRVLVVRYPALASWLGRPELRALVGPMFSVGSHVQL
jgi:hypothetical protein